VKTKTATSTKADKVISLKCFHLDSCRWNDTGSSKYLLCSIWFTIPLDVSISSVLFIINVLVGQ